MYVRKPRTYLVIYYGVVHNVFLILLGNIPGYTAVQYTVVVVQQYTVTEISEYQPGEFSYSYVSLLNFYF